MILSFFVCVVVAANAVPMSVFQDGASFKVQLRQTGTASAFLPQEVAWGKFTDSYDSDGWSLLEVHTNPHMNDTVTSNGAGYFEGYTTTIRIEQQANNMAVQTYNVSTTLDTYLSVNADWMQTMIMESALLQSGTPDRKIFYQASLLLAQLEGIYQGYLAGRKNLAAPLLATPITRRELLLLNLGGDLEDLGEYHSNTVEKPHPTNRKGENNLQHCGC